MAMKIKFAWEALDGQTLRARVAGGWLVRFHGSTGSVAMSLVPDPQHRWEVEVSAEGIREARERLGALEIDLQDPYGEDTIKAEMKEEIINLRQFIAEHG